MIGDRWGVSQAEVGLSYPCDEFVPYPAVQVWRGVSVAAAPDQLWPWVAQIRLAPYSYDWIDNLGRRSPQNLVGLPEPVAGDAFTTAASGSLGRVLSVETNRHLTGRIGGVVMSYLLVPAGRDTRLLLKIVSPVGRLVGPILSLADLVMARRQLLNLKRLAEGADISAAIDAMPDKEERIIESRLAEHRQNMAATPAGLKSRVERDRYIDGSGSRWT